ncbi:cell division protein ZapA [Sphingomonas oleivorans]|uniref:Cell division protein ZapA n=1 Tax=Sphingomonas oleivorans TaxID=1735121 RepID=A0A2T5FYP0_9SPHN|nr:cell division protein ZapA [Sphingomonas oleivorans]PTQ11649.1 cell division protein ZapA [Sphingomonas oleivorans]
MAQVDLRVAGRHYELSCRDGEEARLRELARIVDAKAVEAARALGGVNEARQLLLAALLLADELSELRSAAANPPAGAYSDHDVADLIDRLAERLETLADGLEGRATTS